MEVTKISLGENIPGGTHSKNKGHDTGKDLVCFKNGVPREDPVLLKSEVQDFEKGQVMIKIRNVEFILSALKSPLLIMSHLSGLFIL